MPKEQGRRAATHREQNKAKAVRIHVPTPADVHMLGPELEATLGRHHALDDQTALYSGVIYLPRKRLGELASKARVSIDVYVHSVGDAVQLADGRRFLATEAGRWALDGARP